MAKQKCGTCRFYEEAGFAGSGWCHHPQRTTTTGALVMVRRNELACRDGWDRDLWEAASPADAELPVMRRQPLLGPLPPASREQIGVAVSHNNQPGLAGEDVLLSEARIVSDGPGAWEAPPRPFPAGGFDPRSAIFRAREAYRERSRARAAAIRQATAAEPAAPAEYAEQAGAVPTERDFLPTRQAEPEPAASSISVHSAVEATMRREAAAPLYDESWNRARAAKLQPKSSAEPSVHLSTSTDSEPASPELAPMVQRVRDGMDDEPTALVTPTGEMEQEISALPDRERAQARSELPVWFRTDLPRVCRSCRDYRPSADGQRGWCANAWAFTHRRLVVADEPSPCQSAIGDWWVPVDDVWLVAADVSAHGRATPLLDRLVGEEIAKRRRS